MTAPSRRSTAGARPTRVIASRSGIESANLDGGDGGPHDPAMEARVARLEEDMSEVKGLLYNQILPLLHRIDERLNHTASKVDLSNAATELRAEMTEMRAELRAEITEVRIETSTRLMGIQTELAERPTRSYLWMVVGIMVATVLAAAIGGATLVGLLK
jgi:hypothetical protein